MNSALLGLQGEPKQEKGKEIGISALMIPQMLWGKEKPQVQTALDLGMLLLAKKVREKYFH